MFVLALTFALLSSSLKAAPEYYNCQRPIPSQHQSHSRLISFDINSLELALALGLEERVIYAYGVEDTDRVLPNYKEALKQIKNIKGHYTSSSEILKSKPDLIIGGWNYGFYRGTDISPGAFSSKGIDSYLLSESCIHEDDYTPVTIESVFHDIRTLGSLTDRHKEAEAIITQQEQRLEAIESQLVSSGTPARVFVYDSGISQPFTAGGYSVLNNIIARSGAQNIFSNLNSNWSMVDWQEVASLDPELIIVVDYGYGDGEQKKANLQKRSQLSKTSAVKNNNFLIIPYASAISGIRSVGLLDLLSQRILCKPSQGERLCLEEVY